MEPKVYTNGGRHGVILIEDARKYVTVVTPESGEICLKKFDRRDFFTEYTEIEYDVRRAAGIYIQSTLRKTEPAMRVLNELTEGVIMPEATQANPFAGGPKRGPRVAATSGDNGSKRGKAKVEPAPTSEPVKRGRAKAAPEPAPKQGKVKAAPEPAPKQGKVKAAPVSEAEPKRERMPARKIKWLTKVNPAREGTARYELIAEMMKFTNTGDFADIGIEGAKGGTNRVSSSFLNWLEEKEVIKFL